MALRLSKPWVALTPQAVAKLPGQLGIYELADGEGRVLFIGFAGALSPFGLRGALEQAVRDRPGGAAQFRCEVNQQYTSRHLELLMLHVADHGSLPLLNRAEPPARLGRLSPLAPG